MLWDRTFRRNSSLQAAWDTSIARTYGFYVTSSKMLVHIEGNKIWQLWNSVSVQICGCGLCMRPDWHLLDVLWTYIPGTHIIPGITRKKDAHPLRRISKPIFPTTGREQCNRRETPHGKHLYETFPKPPFSFVCAPRRHMPSKGDFGETRRRNPAQRVCCPILLLIQWILLMTIYAINTTNNVVYGTCPNHSRRCSYRVIMV